MSDWWYIPSSRGVRLKVYNIILTRQRGSTHKNAPKTFVVYYSHTSSNVLDCNLTTHPLFLCRRYKPRHLPTTSLPTSQDLTNCHLNTNFEQ